jgi:isopentenyl diphosphate isomerase/L-lactate dehydrogenase-like FMN-dependent dehydrogenase
VSVNATQRSPTGIEAEHSTLALSPCLPPSGFSPSGGATADAIRVMYHVASPFKVSVKASGGVRTWPDLVKMWSNGADRFGLSGTKAVLAGKESSDGAGAGAVAGAGHAASGGGGGGY